MTETDYENKHIATSVRYVVGTDIGGTFTDLALLDRRSGRVLTEKVLTNNVDPSIPILAGIESLLSKAGLSMGEIDQQIHATTLATNAVIERRGATTGLISTDGHIDTIDLRSGSRYDLYDLNIKFHPPLVQRHLRRGIHERVLPDGSVLVAPSEEEILNCARDLVEHQVEAIAVSLLHSYANPGHEEMVERVIRENFPSLHVTISSKLVPRISEFDRTNTTILNAYVQPLVSRYIDRMHESLRRKGFQGKFFIMTCEGGLVEPSVAKQFPILLLESGPVAGAQICSYLARHSALPEVFGFDMGGTTAKGSVIRDGMAEVEYKLEVARAHEFKPGSGISILVPSVKLIEIGGGGGSIAWVDQRKTIQVGPKSAGANPGPACYGLGGTEPTVTDADLILGYLNPHFFAGGKMTLNVQSASEAIEQAIAKKFGISTQRAAWGIYEQVNESIASAFRLHAAERGIDLRRQSLVVFGGAGPIHGAHIARKLGIRRVVSPLRAGVLSACGLLVVSPEFSLVRTKFLSLSRLDAASYDDGFGQMMAQGKEFLLKAGVPEDALKIRKRLDMRYEGQGFEVEVDDPSGESFAGRELLRNAFEKRYNDIYFMRGISDNIEITNFKVSLAGPSPDINLFSREKPRGSPVKGHRVSYFSRDVEPLEAVVYDRYSMLPGFKIEGPAIVEENESTCIVPPGVTGAVDERYSLILDLK